MKSYKVRLRPLGGFVTPLQADTLFGGLCWSVRYQFGEEVLLSFLDEYRSGNPPVILSNALPGDLFPRPYIRMPTSTAGTRLEKLRSLKEAKRVKSIPFLDWDEFQAMRRGEMPLLKLKEQPFLQSSLLHNQINRLDGRVGGEGGLYAQTEWRLHSRYYQYLTVYLRVKDRFYDLVVDALKALGRTGIGKRRSTGKGAFEFAGCEAADFGELDGANGFISLSTFVPALGDPTVGAYALNVKYGKLSEDYALLFSAFKRPLVLLEAGSCFWSSEPYRPYFGRMVEDIVPNLPQVLHYGLAFPVPAKLA